MTLKIGVFDSGVGGITVLSELRQRFPMIDYVYLGDTAHVPYGPKSPAQIQMLSASCAETFKEKNVDLLIVACNTASSWALPAIGQVMGSIPVLGVVEPGAETVIEVFNALSEDKQGGPILVLATKATVKSQAYSQAIRKRLGAHAPNSSITEPTIIEQACPLLVPMIEEGWLDHPVLHQTILEYVRPYSEKFEGGIALLGCTHYPWIHQAFQKALPNWIVLNSAKAVVDALERNSVFMMSGQSLPGSVEWIFTDPQSVPEFARVLMKT